MVDFCVRASRGILWVSVLLLAMTRVESADFYVDSSAGNDANTGTSTQPWKTLAPANSRAFGPGDRLLLTSGQTFTGPLWLDSGDVGTSASPITVTTTGAAAATISVPGDTPGINVYNAGGFAISNLLIVGPWARTAQSANTGAGLSFYCDILNQRKPYIRIDQVNVSGFRSGIGIGGSNGAAGFTDVRITRVRCHNNQRAGLSTYSGAHYGVTNLYVGQSTFDHNPGDPALTTNSGSGLVLGCVDSAIVERCVAYENGVDCHANEGGCGFWAYDSNNVTFQDNESYSNRSSGVADGDGFDLDGACTNCIIQRNYAHDNDAAGFLCWQYAGAATWSGNVIRYNISQNDCRRLPYGAIHVGTSGPAMGGAEIHHNTIYVSGGAANIAAIRFATSTTGFNVRDNIFITTGGIPLVSVATGQSSLVFNGNDYWSSGGSFVVSWANTQYSTLSSWRTASGQESSGGFAVDPLLVSAGGGGIIGNADNLFTLTAYQLQATSPLIDRGVSLGTVPLGPADFYGSSVPQGAASDVGAHERVGGGGAGNTAPTVSTIVNQTINQGTATGALAVTVGDAQTAAGSLTLTASAANATLLPASGISIGGSGANRTITLTPAATSNGSTLVTLTVSDGSLSSTSSFTLNVQPVPSPSIQITREYWTGIIGSGVANIPLSSPPSGTALLTSLEGPSNWGDNYGTRIRGYLNPTVSGSYIFWLATNDDGELWLSTDDQPFNKRRIASVSGSTGVREWNKFPSQKSVVQTLVAGRRYYIEVLQKENTGSDCLAVGWSTPGQKTSSPSKVVPGSVLSGFSGTTVVTNTAPSVGAGLDRSIIQGASTTLTGITTDDGLPAPAVLTAAWSQVSGPGTVTFSKASALSTSAGFSAAGTYVLQLSVSDGALSTTDSVQVIVNGSSGSTAITREYWTGITGNGVASIPVASPPTGVDVLTSLEGPSNWGDNYGSRVRCLLTPATTGSYTFWLATDDDGELWLSSDDQPATKQRIASVTGWTNIREWSKYPTQKSIAINLVAGRQYYLEVLQKDGGGGDNMAVGWCLPGESTLLPSAVVPGTVLAPVGTTPVLPGSNG